MPKNSKEAKEVEKLKESYNIQKTTLDKIWFYVLMSAKSGVMEGTYFTPDESDRYDILLKTDKKAAEELYGKAHSAYGLPKDLRKSEELDKFESDLNNHIYSTFVDDESSRAVYKGLDSLAIIEIKTCIQVGKELNEMLKRFKEDDPLRMQKAMYVLGLSQSYGTQLEYGVSNFKTNVCMTYPEWTAEQNSYLSGKMSSMSKNLSEEDRKFYKLGIAARDGSHPTSSPEMEKWVNKEGIRLAESIRKVNLAGVYNRINDELATTKPFKIANDKRFTDALESTSRDVSDTFLRGVIKDLESTKTGERHWYQFGWHSENSPEYDKMLQTLKLYEYSVSAGEMAKNINLREKLIGATLNYIKDKTSSVRDSEFGKKRFDDSLMLLSDLMPSRRFKKLVDTINKQRNTRPGKSDYIDINYYSDTNKFRENNLHNKLHFIGRDIDDKKQEAAKSNRLNYIDSFKKNITNIEEKFGVNSVGLPKDEREFTPIGAYLHNDQLDNKDFSALSYVTYVGKRAEASKKTASNKWVRDRDNIEASGKEVAEALKAYQKGNKAPLADIIRNGVNNITKECEDAKFIDGTYIVNAEMGKRLKGMIDRDPELYTIAAKKGMKIDDFRKLTSITHCATTFNRGFMGITNVINAEKGISKITKGDKIEAYTDLVMKRVIDESIVLKKEGKIKDNLLPTVAAKSEYVKLRDEAKAMVLRDGLHKCNSGEFKQMMQSISFTKKVREIATNKVNEAKVTKNVAKKQEVKKGKAPSM